jgi:oxygen-independent coproporphyrinogen-3 oxidase
MAGIYIHIPFCKQACSYCNFYFSVSLGQKEKLIAALLKEIELTQEYLENEKIETIYFGGGTPSLLTGDEVMRVIDKISAYHDINEIKEFTLEANPDDLSKSKVAEFKALKSIGLNRFSIGVQSFFDEDLLYMNRAHNATEAESSIKRVQDAGFDNLTIDLIYGTPTMNDEHWMQNLEKVYQLDIPHISSYALTVEPKTTLFSQIQKGKAKPVDEEQSARQFKILMKEMLANGYEQYEISNYAKPGHYAVHNSNYWFGKKYLGLGPSAHSFNGKARRWNIANNNSYTESLSQSKLNFEEEILTEAQKVNERIMTSLRTQWGLRISDLPSGWQARILELIESDLPKLDESFYMYKDKVLTLTDEGKLFADRIAANLFVE